MGYELVVGIEVVISIDDRLAERSKIQRSGEQIDLAASKSSIFHAKA